MCRGKCSVPQKDVDDDIYCSLKLSVLRRLQGNSVQMFRLELQSIPLLHCATENSVIFKHHKDITARDAGVNEVRHRTTIPERDHIPSRVHHTRHCKSYRVVSSHTQQHERMVGDTFVDGEGRGSLTRHSSHARSSYLTEARCATLNVQECDPVFGTL